MTISLLFSIFIFSLIVFERGLKEFNLGLFNTIGFVVAYSIPIFILEILIRKHLENQPDSKKIFLRSLSVAFLSVFLWAVAVGLFYQPQGEEGMIYIATPVFFIIFLTLNLVLSIIIFRLERKKEGHSFRNISIVVSLLSLFFLLYSGFMLARCDGMGCGNNDYLVARAQRENDPSVCKLAGRMENSSSPDLFLMSSHFYASNISDCYSSLAIKTNNVELCESSGYNKGYCYRALAENLKNPLLCDKITDSPYQKDVCYSLLKDPKQLSEQQLLREEVLKFKKQQYNNNIFWD